MAMDLKLDGKCTIVTGGSRGIGRVIATTLAQEGAHVVIAARNSENLHAAAREIGKITRRKIVPIVFDSRSVTSVTDMVKAAHMALGSVDILVNAAAAPGSVGQAAVLAELDWAGIQSDFETKVLGYLRTAQQVAPFMIEKGWGRIINISGLAARSTGNYSGTMRNVAVAAMTKCLADELGPKGINVSVIHPGATRTERTEGRVREEALRLGVGEAEAEHNLYGGSLIGRIVEPDEIAAIVALLASPISAAINGDAIAAGGGVPKVIYY